MTDEKQYDSETQLAKKLAVWVFNVNAIDVTPAMIHDCRYAVQQIMMDKDFQETEEQLQQKDEALKLCREGLDGALTRTKGILVSGHPLAEFIKELLERTEKEINETFDQLEQLKEKK